MKFSLAADTLADTIAAGVTSVPAKPTEAVMGGVLIEAEAGSYGNVSFSSFNYERATTRITMADVLDPGRVVVSGRLLSAIGSNLPRSATCEIVATDSQMTINAGRTEFRLPLLQAGDYPTLPSVTQEHLVGTVDCDEFADAVRVVGGYASEDPATELQNLTALNLRGEPGSLSLCATDRYIIGRRRLDWTCLGDPVEINVPAADVLATIKALTGPTPGEQIEILWNGSLLGLRSGATTVITRTLGNEFPKVAAIMKTDQYYAAVTVFTPDLMAVLRRAWSIADDQHAQVDIYVDDDTLSIETTQSGTGKTHDAITATHHGGARRLALSSRRLYNALSIIDHDQVTLGFREKGYLLTIHPGPTDANALGQPERDSIALLQGIRVAQTPSPR